MKTHATGRKTFLWLAGVLILVVTMVIGLSSASAKSAKEIDISVDVTLEQFEKDIKGGCCY